MHSEECNIFVGQSTQQSKDWPSTPHMQLTCLQIACSIRCRPCSIISTHTCYVLHHFERASVYPFIVATHALICTYTNVPNHTVHQATHVVNRTPCGMYTDTSDIGRHC